jgi:hypothetical protein
MARRLAALAGICIVALLALRPPPAVGAWRLPVRGPVVRSFAYSPSVPFRAGSRRGVDLAVRPFSSVRAPCSGRVTFAGTIPSRMVGLSIRCGSFVATELGLASVAVRRGAVVLAGAVVGKAGEAGVVRLGARRIGERWGYVDPLRLLGREPVVQPPSALPLGRAPRGAPLRPLLPPPLVGPENVDGRRFRGPRPQRAPLLLWIALALLAAGAGTGGLRRAGSLRGRWAPSTSPRRSTT